MNTNNCNEKPEAIQEALRLREDLMQQVSPIVEKQESLQEIMTSVKATVPTIDVPVIPKNPIFTILGEFALSTQIPDYSFTNPILSQISSGVSKIVQAFSSEVSQPLAKTVSDITINLGRTMADALQSPAMKWLQSLDLSPMYKTLEALREIYKQREAFRNAYLAAMYECKWFPYAGWLADPSLAAAVSEVIKTSRGASIRREKRIDKLIISYYNPKKINAIKRSWKNTDMEPHIKRILCQSLDAHLRGEYALCISSLATMWEGLIYIKANNVSMQDRHRQRMTVTKQELENLTKANDYSQVFSDYFNNFIVSQCDKVET